jgi:hypothetical protein
MATEKCCQTCKFHSTGNALDFDGNPIPKGNSGEFWTWQDCTKGWGKPTPIGVLKNMCGLYQPKNK